MEVIMGKWSDESKKNKGVPNSEGTRFTSDNQPSPEAKSKGKQASLDRRKLKDWLYEEFDKTTTTKAMEVIMGKWNFDEWYHVNLSNSVKTNITVDSGFVKGMQMLFNVTEDEALSIIFGSINKLSLIP